MDIVVCNDDGASAPGILHLIQAARPFGKIWAVAPDSPQSGMGHAISLGKPLRLQPHAFSDEVQGWSCNGTPVDCVKLATGVLLKHKPDLLVSGINHGANSSISVFYSGTMSAAVEGGIEGIPSVGFSLCNFSIDADFTAAQHIAGKVIQHLLAHPLPVGVVLNVNIPNLPLDLIRGVRVTRMAIGRWVEEFDQRTDPYGRNYYWLTGRFHTDDHGADTDEVALAEGYVSVCPIRIDITHTPVLEHIQQWDIKL